MASQRDNTVGAAAISILSRLLRTRFDHYRPEHHYMRGPGPKWREKHEAAARPADLPEASPAHI